jgi:hypothetical protein
MKNTKYIMAAIVIIILLAIAYFAFYKTLTQNNSQTPADGASQGKLNINVVCDNALTYMTFENQTLADKFLVECKEGRHPEVIEKYKIQMNLGNGATI